MIPIFLLHTSGASHLQARVLPTSGASQLQAGCLDAPCLQGALGEIPYKDVWGVTTFAQIIQLHFLGLVYFMTIFHFWIHSILKLVWYFFSLSSFSLYFSFSLSLSLSFSLFLSVSLSLSLSLSLFLSLSLSFSLSLSLFFFLYPFSPLTSYLWTFLSLLGLEKFIFT